MTMSPTPDGIEPLLDLHPLPSRPGLRASGEISLPTQAAWEAALESLVAQDDDVYLDLSGLTFVDVAGTRILAHAAQRLTVPRRILLAQPPPSLRRALDMFWPDLETIEVTR